MDSLPLFCSNFNDICRENNAYFGLLLAVLRIRIPALRKNTDPDSRFHLIGDSRTRIPSMSLVWNRGLYHRIILSDLSLYEQKSLNKNSFTFDLQTLLDQAILKIVDSYSKQIRFNCALTHFRPHQVKFLPFSDLKTACVE